jgi:hypothetical protein
LNEAVRVGMYQTTGQVMSNIVNGANQALPQRGFVEILPNQKHTYGPFTLTSMNPEECIRARPFREERMFTRIDNVTLYAIILSGETDGSNLDHSIQ